MPARAVALAATLLCVAAIASEDRFATERAEFVAAYADAATGDPARDSRALRRYALYPYLQSARLEHALNASTVTPETDAAAEAFLERHGAEPVARQLRRAWLHSLARRERWQTFLEHYRDGGDAALQCQELNARIALAGDAASDGALEADVTRRWLTGRRLPSECETAFTWLRARGVLTAELIAQRVRLLLDAGHASFARVIARRLPAESAAPLLRWADLIERPARSLDALLADRSLQTEPEILLDAFSRLARAEPHAALERFEPLRAAGRIDGDSESRHALALAFGLAWDRRPEALELFARVSPEDLDDYALGWYARAALWNGAWLLAEDAIAAMSASARDETRWRYWAARAAETRGDTERASELYRSILPRDNFYSALAAARLGQRVVPHASPLPRDDSLLEAIAEGDFFVRARELVLADMRTEAVSEWLAGLVTLDGEERLQAVHLAAQWEWHDIAIATASRQGVFFDYALLYPTPYEQEVEAAAAAAALDQWLLYGLIRQESLFRPDARSSAGAVGLAQLVPDTARIAASMVAEPPPRGAELLEPDRNVRLGAAYLRVLVERFGGQTVVGLAGYNAGPLAAERWLPPRPVETDVWIENIPYNETRDYVQRVLWHSLVFAWLADGEAQDADEWPAYVRPSEPASVARR